MPCILTSVHDPVALAATCRRLNLLSSAQGCVHLDDREASGWIIHLPGVRFPIVCDTLTGLIAYHPVDNAFGPYARIMRWIHRYYEVRARRHQSRHAVARRHPAMRPACRLVRPKPLIPRQRNLLIIYFGKSR